MSEPVLLRGDGGRFLPGNGSTGRPKGARNRLGERFLHDLHQDWQVHGPSVLARVREEEPGTYLRVIAALAAHLTPRAAPEEPSAPVLVAGAVLPVCAPSRAASTRRSSACARRSSRSNRALRPTCRRRRVSPRSGVRSWLQLYRTAIMSGAPAEPSRLAAAAPASP